MSLHSDSQLETLKIINSQLTTFNCNLPSLKNLVLLNNSRMTSLSNCNLPSLQNLTIVNTNTSNFQNNTFGSLVYVEITNATLNALPALGTTVKDLILINNNLTALKVDSFPKL